MERSDRKCLILLAKSLNFSVGGMEEHQRAFIEYFGQLSDIDLYVGELRQEGMAIYKFQSGCVNILGCYRDATYALAQLIGNKRHPIIFSNDFWTLETLSELRRVSNKGMFVIRSGGNDIEKMPWGNNQLPYETRKKNCINALKSLDAIIINSQFSKSRFLSYGVSTRKLYIIRGGVNQEVCLKVKKNKSQLRHQLSDRLGIEEPFIFTFACRFVEFKGISLALQAIAESSYKDCCHLILAGEGEMKDDLSIICRQLGLKATFLGPLQNSAVLEVMGASNLFFNTSIEYVKTFRGHSYIHTETMGRSMMEAINVHTPVIATRVGGTPELFSETESIGVMAECCIESVTDAIEYAMTHQFSFNLLVDYSWNNIFDQYIHLVFNDTLL